LSDGDILINRVNSPNFLGKTALVRGVKEPCVFESNMMRLRLDISQVKPDYANLYLQSFSGITQLRKNAKHAINQSSINQEDVKSVLVNLPPVPEQLEIMRRVEELLALGDRILTRFEGARASVNRLMPSLLAKAFRGELVPTEASLAQTQGREFESAEELLANAPRERGTDSRSEELGKRNQQKLAVRR